MTTAPYIITRHEATIDVAELMNRYLDAERVRSYCVQCSSYGKVWSCPPFDFTTEDYLTGLVTAHIFGTKIAFGDTLLSRQLSVDERKAVMAEAIDTAWADELPRLYALEASHPGSRIFTGRCRLCRPLCCSRVSNEPCRHPRRLRHSLESLGFDLEKTAADLLGIPLQWATEGKLPPYITLITAHFTP